jgi:hypothetical protein
MKTATRRSARFRQSVQTALINHRNRYWMFGIGLILVLSCPLLYVHHVSRSVHVEQAPPSTTNVDLIFPFPNVPITIDNTPYVTSERHLKLPLTVGNHRLHIRIPGVNNADRILLVPTLEHDKSGKQEHVWTQTLSIEPSEAFASAVKTFLTRYNTEWCEAVNTRNPDRILPYLQGHQSSEYQFLAQYIQSLDKQSWMQDYVSLERLDTTQVRFEDAKHLMVQTTEVYHHVMRILQDHENWRQGATKEYNDTVTWIYEIKWIDDHTFQIESLRHPAQS